jgi:hypothetical protein
LISLSTQLSLGAEEGSFPSTQLSLVAEEGSSPSSQLSLGAEEGSSPSTKLSLGVEEGFHTLHSFRWVLRRDFNLYTVFPGC